MKNNPATAARSEYRRTSSHCGTSPRKSKPPNKTAGFTLMELSITLAIAITISGMVFIAASGDNRAYRELHNTALMIQSDLRYAQRLSIIEGRRIYTRFNMNSDSYSIVSQSPANTFRYVNFPDGVEICGERTRGFWFDTTSSYIDIPFTPRGTYGTQAGTIYLQNGEHRLRITLTVSGGRALIRCYPESRCTCR